MPKQELVRALNVGQDGTVQALVKDDEGQDQLATFHLYIDRETGTPVYKEKKDPGIEQDHDPFSPSRRKSVRERWIGIDQPVGESQ